MNVKFKSYLGLARKSGNLILGLDKIEESKKDIFVLVFSNDVSDRTKKKSIEKSNCDIIIQTDMCKADLGKLLGVQRVAVSAVTDKGLANQIQIYAGGNTDGINHQI